MNFLRTIALVVLIVSNSALLIAFDAEPIPSDDLIGAGNEEAIEVEPTTRAPILVLGGRIDASLTAGLPSQQGFSIPSVRLSASGEVSDHISYQLALGQTREFSTVLLPQLLPVYAYFDYSSRDLLDLGPDVNLRWRFGLFNPSLNPWWTPDLSDVPFPDYFLSHQALLLSRDIGTELTYEWLPYRLHITVGAFNGNGIFGINSNNSRSFNALVSARFSIGNSQLTVGSSAYTMSQSSQGSLNYKTDWAWDLFANLDLLPLGLTLGAEGFLGNFEDNTGSTSPVGGAGSMILDLSNTLQWFVRGEFLSHPPTGEADPMRHFQIGPILILDGALKIFTFYDYLNTAGGSEIHSGQLRARLLL